MKKRVFSLLLAAVVLLPMLAAAAPAHAAADADITYLPDGTYLVYSLETDEKVPYAARSGGQTSGTAKLECFTEKNEVLWRVILSAAFTYDGNSATCTEASLAMDYATGSYFLVEENTVRSGNHATSNFVVGYKILFATVGKESHVLTIFCDNNGNVSHYY